MSVAVVHQTLHGYSDGHRLIAGSLSLSTADARTMLVMSDLSGPGVKPGPSGYLTGYALEGAGKYVLARTWSAPEMSRPGCVWTHSLIVDNADLAMMHTATGFLDAFRRPNGAVPGQGYGDQLRVPLTEDKTGSIIPTAMAIRASEVLNALYAAPGKAVVLQAAVREGEDERLVTGIWAQQWPRLRRTFGFCTLTKVDRSVKGEALDLQMVPSGERQLRSKFANAVNPAEVAEEPALSKLRQDLMWPSTRTSDLREFLRRTGGDVDGGRRAMVPLCRIYNAVFATETPDLSEAVAAFDALDGFGRRQARSLRVVVARRAIESVDSVDDAVFNFMVDALADFPPTEDSDLGPRFGKALWTRSPARFLQALDEEGPLGRASAEALGQIPADDLVAGLREDALAAQRIASVRPDLMQRADFWRVAIGSDLLDFVDAASAGRVARALIGAARSDGAEVLIEKADPQGLAEALETDDADEAVLRQWTRTIVRNLDRAAGLLANGSIRRAETLVLLAREMGPDDLPNQAGEDPWWIAARGAARCRSQSDQDFLAAFLMARALGGQTRSVADLIRHTYTQVYEALERSRLSYDVERMVAWRLEWGSWFEWDRASRLRTTVVDRFVEGKLDPETFGRLSDDHRLTEGLLKEAARTEKGRRYLNEVRKRLRDASEEGIRARADYIAKLIR